MAFAEYDRHDALGLADLVRRGQVSAVELLDEAIARADKLNPAINAIVARLDEPARAAAKAGLPDGPFRGVPFLVKDLGPRVAGAPMTMGSRSLRNYRAEHDGELIRRYRAAGLNIFGKTNTPEFGNSAYTEPVLFGPCRNPWDLGRTPGGSSGGSAAAIAAGIVPMAHGNDGGGSLRIPASCVGVFGFKPSRGRMPRDADTLEALGALAIDHVMSRSVRDSAAALDATHGGDYGLLSGAPTPAETYLSAAGRDPGKLRVAVIKNPMFGRAMDAECKTAQEDAARLLASLGHAVEEAEPKIDYAEATAAFILLFFAEMAHSIALAGELAGHPVTRSEIELVPWFARAYYRSRSADAIAQAIEVQAKVARTFATFMADYDLLLTPTVGSEPIAIGALQPTKLEAMMIDLASATRFEPLCKMIIKELGAKAFAWTPYTEIFNLTGQPGMSLPLHWSAKGLPVGVQLIGRYGDEFTLFQVAGQIERARPWFDKRPPAPKT